MKIDLKDEKTRTAVLGAAAVLMIAILVLKTFVGGGTPEEVAPSRERPKKNATELKVAVTEHKEDVLQKIYKPILDADPFKAHLFLPKSKGGPKRGDPGFTDTAPIDTSVPPAGTLALRLTAIMALDSSGLTGFFENRNTNKGIFVKKGDSFGSRSVSDVRSDSVLLASVAPAGSASVAPIATAILILGDRLDLSLKDMGQRFKDIGPVMTTSQSAAPSGANANPWASKNTVQLSETERESVLDRLKKKRKDSLGGEAPK